MVFKKENLDFIELYLCRITSQLAISSSECGMKPENLRRLKECVLSSPSDLSGRCNELYFLSLSLPLSRARARACSLARSLAFFFFFVAKPSQMSTLEGAELGNQGGANAYIKTPPLFFN